MQELKKGNAVKLNLSETQLYALKPCTQFLERENVLRLAMTGEVSIGPGVLHGCMLHPMSRLSAIMSDSHFKLEEAALS
jgi:hypothetical protein